MELKTIEQIITELNAINGDATVEMLKEHLLEKCNNSPDLNPNSEQGSYYLQWLNNNFEAIQWAIDETPPKTPNVLWRT